MSEFMKKVFGLKPKENAREIIEDILDEAGLDNEKEISDHEKLLLNNVLYLRDRKCYQVMTARANVLSFPKTGKIGELAELMVSKGHSRIPIYGKDMDDIVGIVHIIDLAKSLIDGDKESPVSTIIKNGVKFISPSMRVPDLLSEMQREKVHMAVVVDEYGGMDGIVTIEDLLEEIVGDIEDEYDISEPLVAIKKDNNSIVADASALIEEINDIAGIRICDDSLCEDLEIETLGGLVSHYAQKLPNVGEVIKGDNGIEFRVLDVDSRKIKKVMIVLPHDERNNK
ncbi:MAG: hemolysin family protein [Lactobacillaceae bacterium]|jgi:CBS domain containing-hemolysin-like protein|nr:hemolysin family protein [Lactobacillaceae bacterium]